MTPDQYRREGAEAMHRRILFSIEDDLCEDPIGAIRAIDVDEVLAGLPKLDGVSTYPPTRTGIAADHDAVARLIKLADQLDQNAINAERMVALLQPEFDAFLARSGHNVYVVRDYVDHQNAAKRQRQEALDIRAALAAMGTVPDAVERLVEAARVFANWDHCWPGNINLEAACRDIRAALAVMEDDHD